VARFEVHHAQHHAKQLGPHVEKLVDELFSGSHPLRHLRRVQGILRLAKRYPITPDHDGPGRRGCGSRSRRRSSRIESGLLDCPAVTLVAVFRLLLLALAFIRVDVDVPHKSANSTANLVLVPYLRLVATLSLLFEFKLIDLIGTKFERFLHRSNK